MIRAGIVGGSGLVGFNLARLLRRENVRIGMITSSTLAGKSVREYYGKEFDKEIDTGLHFTAIEFDQLNELDIVFLAVPHGDAKQISANITTRIIDMSADHRLEWTYGLPEIYAQGIRASERIANPGCYATACILSVYPIRDMIEDIVFDCISGYSGGGKNPSYDYHGNIIAYKLRDHHHVREISHELGMNISFAPHVIDTFSGLMCTAHIRLKRKLPIDDVVLKYQNQYQNTRTRVMRDIPDTKMVVDSDVCVIGGFVYDNNDKLVVVSVIDNLMKGAASQALENMRLMLHSHV
ncbi:MAG: Asd/ArgC dimerization domain-containing protein [candidate division KSB1 bacterium]|jgi:N-acetyl-gamma-glutamyl-phosphate reductase|nr:Asd/ArgC dimerization domain-containing protein [candidate division KSB1 bacterium]